MASSILERLLIKFDPDLSGLDRGYAQAERESKQFVGRMQQNLRGIGDGLTNLSLGSLIGAGGLVYGLQQTAQEFTKASAAERIFTRQVARSGESYDTAAGAVTRLSNTFGVLETDVQGSMALLLRAGVPLQTIEGVLKSAGASALQTGFDVNTAMQNIAVGVSQGRSEVVESAGVIANASTAWQQYADANGRTVESLSNTERAIAYANAIIEESKFEVDDLIDTMAGLPRVQAEANREWRNMRRDLGETVTGALIPAYGTLANVLGFVNNLPKPLRDGGAAAVVAATGVTALGTAAGALLLVLGPLAGPVGWIALLTAGVIGLGVALQSTAGADAFEQKQKDIAEAADLATTAIGSATSKEGLIQALAEFNKAVGEDAGDNLEKFRQEMETTGADLETLRGKAFEAAKQMQLAQLQAERTRALAAARGGQSDITFTAEQTSSGVVDSVYSQLMTINRLLQEGGRANAAGVIRETEARLTRTLGFEVKLKVIEDPESGKLVARLQAAGDRRAMERVRELEAQIKLVESSEPAPLPEETGSGGASKERTSQNVLDELSEFGRKSLELAQQLGTPEAAMEDLQKRIGLVDAARQELIDDFNFAPASDTVVYLSGRLADLQAQLERAEREQARRERSRSRAAPTATSEAIDAQQEGQLSRLTDVPYATPTTVNAQNEYQRSRQIGAAFDQGAQRQADAAKEQADAEYIIADQKERQREINLDLLRQAMEINANTQSAMAAAAEKALAEDRILRQQLEDNYYRGQMVTSYGKESTFNDLSSQLLGFAGSNEEFDRLADSVRQAGVEAQLTQAQMQALLDIIERMQGGEVRILGKGNLSDGTYADSGVNEGDVEAQANVIPKANREHEEAMREINGALISGLQGVFVQAAQQLGAAIASGDFSEVDTGSLVGGLVGAAGTFLGNLILPGLGSFLGPILGGLVGGLLGGNDEEKAEQRREEELSRRGGASSIEINFFVNQTNNFTGQLDQAKNETQLDARIRVIVREMLQAYDPKKFTQQGAGAGA